ncbi:hypothetical protein [Jiella marina]|uniref:hypothetical protein n=1 Tax=Jiella sp. LLJ827 TaxID=2917712 RepID=UPI002100E148|nr:hypothetical protein [Jiella sp. LLJ827]MCQ0986493.1 hypothetical protein [Jiella sp. LLJ827]
MANDLNHIPDVPLSATVMSDLLAYHAALEAGLDDEITPKQITARAIGAIADVRLGSLMILEAAIEFIDAGRPDYARMLLAQMAEKYRDIGKREATH